MCAVEQPAQASRAAAGTTRGRRSAVKDTVTIYSQNSRGLRTDKLEEVLATMKEKNIFAWCVQESWRIKMEQLDHHDTGCLSINHGPDEKLCRRGSLGVMIILSPLAKAAYERGGCKKKVYGLRIVSVLLVMEDEKGKMIKLRLVSAYAPTSSATDDKHDMFRGHLRQVVQDAQQQDEILIVGADINASCGRHGMMMDDENVQSPVGRHGINWVNKAGEQMLTFCGLNNLCLPKSFFQKNYATRGTWKHPGSNRWYEIDQFLMKREDLKRVVDCGTRQRHSAYSDHTAIFMKIRLAKGLKAPTKPKVKRFSRDRLQCEDTANMFVKAATDFIRKEYGDDFPYNEEDAISTQQVLQQAFRAAEEALGSTKKKRNPGWYKMRQVELQKLVETRNVISAGTKMIMRKMNVLRHSTKKMSALQKCQRKKNIRQCEKAMQHANGKLRSVQSKLKKEVKKAKLEWITSRIDRLNKTGACHFVGSCWEAAHQIAEGPNTKHKRTPQTFRDPETGEEAESAERSGEVLTEHLNKLLNAVPNVLQSKLDSVRQRQVNYTFNDPPSDEEIVRALKRQNPGKATGDSDIPAEYYKLCLDDPLLYRLFKGLIQRTWTKAEPVPKEWLEGRIKMLPKSGDLLDPGRWRSITLLDAAGKVMSTILTNRLNNILAEEGLEEQNGFSPGRGTIDGSFCVRTMLKKRKEHDVETWAYFLDLVKAFDTVPRKALLIVLGKFGVPEQMVSMIAGMLQGNIVKLQVQKKSAEKDGVMEDIDTTIPSTAGVPQGNSMSPVLFVIYIQAVLETLDLAFAEAGVQRDKLVYRTRGDHVIHGRRWNDDAESFTVGEALYADDACFAFSTRQGLCEGAVVIDRHFTGFGLQVHKGREGKKSKTECMFFPPAGTSYENADTSNVPVDGGYYTFCKRFKYLGSIITCDLQADDDVKTRIRCAAHAFNLMRNVFTARSIKPSVKAQLYKVIVCTVLLYGSECWAMRQDLLDKLEKFHNQCVRKMANVTLRTQWFQNIRNTDLRRRFMTRFKRKGGTKDRPILKPLGTIEDMLTERNLRWAGHVARMPPTRLPRKLLTGHVPHKRPIGRPFQTFGHAVARSLKVRINQIAEFLGPDDQIEGSEEVTWNAYTVANALRWRGAPNTVAVDCTVDRGSEGAFPLGIKLDKNSLCVTEVYHARAAKAGFRVGDKIQKIQKAKVETITEVVGRLDALSARGKSTVVCRVRRSYREGDPTWIDIANDRKLWTSLVYELFHDAKNY